MNNSAVSTWTESMVYFKNGDYRPVLNFLNSAGIDSKNDILLYFKAVSNYNLGEYQASLQFFNLHQSCHDSVFYFDTEFRIGFAWYKRGETQKAKQQFQKIAHDKMHPYTEEAEEILQKLF
jgi:tetratricopeptide (TPR) repeat protein